MMKNFFKEIGPAFYAELAMLIVSILITIFAEKDFWLGIFIGYSVCDLIDKIDSYTKQKELA